MVQTTTCPLAVEGIKLLFLELFAIFLQLIIKILHSTRIIRNFCVVFASAVL